MSQRTSHDPPAGWPSEEADTRGRDWGLAAVLLVATAFFLAFVQRHYPIGEWLFWRYATCWAACFVWSAACFSAEYSILRRLR